MALEKVLVVYSVHCGNHQRTNKQPGEGVKDRESAVGGWGWGGEVYNGASII